MKHFFNTYGQVLLTLAVFALMLLPVVAGADGTGSLSTSNSVSSSNCGPHTLCNPLGGITSVCQLVLALLNAVMVIGVPVAILFIIWAGFKFIIAQGNPGELGEAKTNFYHVIIGIAIFLGASLIASVIINTLQNLGVQGINSC